MPVATEIEYRWLDGDQIAQIEPVLLSMNAMSVNREQSRVIAAYDKERLIGFFVMQLIPHMEPLYVDPDYQERRIAINLVARMVDFMKECNARGAMLVAESPGVEKLAEYFGMERIQYPMYSKINMGDGI